MNSTGEVQKLEDLLLRLLKTEKEKNGHVISNVQCLFQSDQSDFDAGVTVTLDNGKLYDIYIVERK